MEDKKYYESKIRVLTMTNNFKEYKFKPVLAIPENDIDVMRDIVDICDENRQVDAIFFNKERDGMGDISDGYHTFNELYHHRALLFAAYCNLIKDKDFVKCWKSKLHHDGTMYDGMFIVGISTPIGQASYHYDIEPYWDLFDVEELDNAPEWDGHTPDEAIERIFMMSEYEKDDDVLSDFLKSEVYY